MECETGSAGQAAAVHHILEYNYFLLVVHQHARFKRRMRQLCRIHLPS